MHHHHPENVATSHAAQPQGHDLGLSNPGPEAETCTCQKILVDLVPTDQGLTAYPMGKGSGSVTTSSSADGFITIGQHTEIVDAGDTVDVQLLGQGLEPADLILIGSHCVGLDWLSRQLSRRGMRIKTMTVGSTGGLMAAKRGECDVAGIHLMDPVTGIYNRSFMTWCSCPATVACKASCIDPVILN